MTCKSLDLATGMAAAALVALAVPGKPSAAVLAPDYRGAPNSVFVVFEPLATTAGWTVADFDFVDGGFPLFSDPAESTDINAFFIPNFIDPLPEKLMRISLECGTLDCGGIGGSDVFVDPFDETDGIEDVSFLGSGPVSNGQSEVTGSFFFDFRILPNPDFESVFIDSQKLSGAEIQRITIDTVSREVPLPAALPLFALALAGLGWAARGRAS